MTGIDRVERAWLDGVLGHEGAVFGLVRSAPGFAFLDRRGLLALAARLDGQTTWGKADILSRLHLRQSADRRRALSDVRRLALAGCAVLRQELLGSTIQRHCGAGVVYLNVGHSNLDARTLGAVRAATGLRIVVLLHDTIPLDHPEFTRPGQDRAFAEKLAAVSAHADRIVHISRASRRAAEPYLARLGRVPPGVVAHLGVCVPEPRPDELSADFQRLVAERPCFLALGTIEPRKNHAFLLDLWDALGHKLAPEAMPALVIAGSRGWRNDAVLNRLDAALKARPQHVFEASGLSDGAVAALLSGSRALLFPSLAEGFGLPGAEAAALGVPVVCHDLPVTREILGLYPVYADVRDAYPWQNEIMALSRPDHPQRRQRAVFQTWAAHFDTALKDL